MDASLVIIGAGAVVEKTALGAVEPIVLEPYSVRMYAWIDTGPEPPHWTQRK